MLVEDSEGNEMFRKMFTWLVLITLLSFCHNTFANQQPVAHFKRVKLLLANYDYYGEWKSRAYSHPMKNGGKCLIVCTHGCIDYDGYFRICIGSEQSRDYVYALENELIYWHNCGRLNLNEYDHIHLMTCYSGYMQSQFTLPRLNKAVYVISDYLGITYYSEITRNGRLVELEIGNVY